MKSVIVIIVYLIMSVFTYTTGLVLASTRGADIWSHVLLILGGIGLAANSFSLGAWFKEKTPDNPSDS